PRQWLLAADFLSEGPQRLQRMLPRMRIDVREERALPLPLGREWLLGRETCPTGYHVGRGVRHQILAWLDSGEEAGTSPGGGLRLPECGPPGGQRPSGVHGHRGERADLRQRGQ